MQIEVYDALVHYKFSINRRFSVITGDSGIGKSVFYTMIEDYNRNGSYAGITIAVPKGYHLITSTEESWQRDMSSLKSAVIVLDEFDAVCSDNFCTMYKNLAVQNNLWFIVMTRIEKPKYDRYKRLSYSVNALYTVATIDNVHYNVPLYNEILTKYKSQLFSFDAVLVEDTKAGYEFFRRLFYRYNVRNAESGKSNIVSVLKEMEKAGCLKVLLFVDLASYGCHMNELKSFIYYSNMTVYIIDFYECFEYLLLTTNLLNHKDEVIKEFNNIEYFANQSYSWEKYFEELLKRVTDGKRYKQGHGGKLNPCYYKDCYCCGPYIMEKCDNVLQGTKFIELLRKTPFEFLLKYV